MPLNTHLQMQAELLELSPTLFRDAHPTLAVDCGPLDYPPKGRVSLSGTTVGSTATYSCERGYVLVGERKRECLVTGEWSVKEPVCTGKGTCSPN